MSQQFGVLITQRSEGIRGLLRSSLLPIVKGMMFIVVSLSASSSLHLVINQDAPQLSIPQVRRSQLLNGFKILAVEGQPQPRIAVSLAVRIGSLADPQGLEGLASMTAQGVRFANRKIFPEGWKNELDYLDGTLDILVDGEVTIFQSEIPPSSLGALLTFLSNVVVQPVFQEEGLEQARKVVRSGSPHSPLEVGNAEFVRLVFSSGSCARSEAATAESLNTIHAADLDLFHRTHYLPNNSVLVIAGLPVGFDFSGMVREKFGSWLKADREKLLPLVVPSLSGKSVGIVEGEGTDDVTLLMGHPMPGRQTVDYFPLRLANVILGNLGKTSRIEQALTAKKVLYRSVRSEMQFGEDCSLIKIVVQIPVSSLQPAFEAILEGIEDLKILPPSEEEMTLARNHLTESQSVLLRSPVQLANETAKIELFDLARDLLVGVSQRVEQITADRVQEVSKTYLSSSRLVVVAIGNSHATREAIHGMEATGNLSIDEIPGGLANRK